MGYRHKIFTALRYIAWMVFFHILCQLCKIFNISAQYDHCNITNICCINYSFSFDSATTWNYLKLDHCPMSIIHRITIKMPINRSILIFHILPNMYFALYLSREYFDFFPEYIRFKWCEHNAKQYNNHIISLGIN